MSEVDHVLQARDRVESLANELQKIKETAELFDGAQSKQEALIKAADAVVEHAGGFVNDATEIIGNLRQMNLAQRLDDLERDLKEISHLLGRQFDRLGGHLDDIRKSTDELRQAADGIVSRVAEEHETTRVAVDERIESVAKSILGHLKTVEERQSQIFEHLQAFRREAGQQLDSFRKQSLIATGAVGILVTILIVLQFV